MAEDKIDEEKALDGLMDREDIIENYVQHVRDISELSDDEMASVLDDTIEEDEDVLDILERLLSKIENIREKIVYIQTERKDERKDEIEEDKDERKEEIEEDKDERKEEIEDILAAFDDADYAYPIEEIVESLKGSGYVDPGSVIVDAISDDILCVDSIDEDNIVYIALTKEGESLWKLHNC